MATILEFRVAGEKPRSRRGRRQRRSAEIVIFPGVRYERWESTAVGDTASAAVVRDKLQLVD